MCLLDAHQAVPWRTANPGTAFGADQLCADAPAMGCVAVSRLNPRQAESFVGHDDAHLKRAVVRRWQSLQWHV